MKLIIFLALTALTAAQDSTYTTKYDHIDVEEILKSDRLFKGYYNCIMDLGPCTPEGTEIKLNLPEALEHACAKCSEKQKEIGLRVLSHLIDNRPDEWAALRAKYDPENKFIEKYRAEVEAAGIKL